MLSSCACAACPRISPRFRVPLIIPYIPLFFFKRWLIYFVFGILLVVFRVFFLFLVKALEKKLQGKGNEIIIIIAFYLFFSCMWAKEEKRGSGKDSVGCR